MQVNWPRLTPVPDLNLSLFIVRWIYRVSSAWPVSVSFQPPQTSFAFLTTHLFSATIAAAVAGTAAAAAYFDAKYHIRSDLSKGSLDNAAIEAQNFMAEKEAANELTLFHDIQGWAKKDIPNHLFLEYQGRSWTYKQFYEDIVRVGNWLMNDLGVKRDEMVAISGPNSAEYLLLWFAIDGIGADQSFVKYATHCLLREPD